MKIVFEAPRTALLDLNSGWTLPFPGVLSAEIVGKTFKMYGIYGQDPVEYHVDAIKDVRWQDEP